MSFHDRREFDKFLKFLTSKLVQTIVQSRKGDKIKTKSVVNGNDWFNLAIPDDKQVGLELKRSLEGRLPEEGVPICLEIIMDSTDGDSLVLENWTISLDTRSRDISISVGHVLYPRLSLALKSVVTLARSTPAYRLSRASDEGTRFNFRVFSGSPKVPGFLSDFKHVKFASCPSPHGTVSLTLSYRTSLSTQDRPLTSYEMPTQHISPSETPEITSLTRLDLPFASINSQPDNKTTRTMPFVTVLPRQVIDRQESTSTVQCEEDQLVMDGLDSLPETQVSDGYVMVQVGEIKPAFVARSPGDELSELLQNCNEERTLDLFSGEGSMDVSAAMDLLDQHS